MQVLYDGASGTVARGRGRSCAGDDIQDEIDGADEIEVNDSSPGFCIGGECPWREVQLKILECGGFSRLGLAYLMTEL